MGATPVFTLPWPELGDLADGPDGYQDLALAVEAALLGQRDTADDLAYTPAWQADGPMQPGGAQWTARYSVRSGACSVWIFGQFTASTTGGKGILTVGLPVRSRVSYPEGQLQVKYWMPGLANFTGTANVPGNSLFCRPLLPYDIDRSGGYHWQSTDNAGSAGSGIPSWPGTHSVINGGNICITGRYLV